MPVGVHIGYLAEGELEEGNGSYIRWHFIIYMYKILKNKEKLNLNAGLWRHISGKGYLLGVGDRRIARACWLSA